MKRLNLIAQSSFWVLVSLFGGSAYSQANNFSIGLSYGNGGGYTGAPIFGYGAGYGSMGAIAQCLPPWSGGAGSVVSGYIPPTSTLPVLRTPPRNQIGIWGGGGYPGYPGYPGIPYPGYPYPGYPYPGYPGHGCGGYGCGGPYPVPGGPVVYNRDYSDIYGYGSDVVDTRLSFSWHKSDIPDIVGNMAGGLAELQTGVHPVRPVYQPRYNVPPHSTGTRGYDLYERDLESHY